MAKYTVKQLAEYIGTTTDNIHAWCSPSKRNLIKDEDGLIDTEYSRNLEFINKKKFGVPKLDSPVKKERKKSLHVQLNKTVKELTKKPKPEKVVKEKIVKPPKEKIVSPPKEKIEKPEVSEKKSQAKEQRENNEKLRQEVIEKKINEQRNIIDEVNDYERKKRNLTIKKLEKEVRLKEIEIEKAEGDYISFEEACTIIKLWSQSRDTALLEAIETKIQIICVKAGLESDMMAKYLKDIPEILNKTSELTNKTIMNKLKERLI
jgi:hypothetical protein